MGLADITPERVRAAYLEKGWKPIRWRFGFGDQKCGCALGVLYGPDEAFKAFCSGQELANDELKSIPYKQLQQFAMGFDGRTPVNAEDLSSPAYLLGRACWEAVKDLAVKEVGA